MPGAPPPAAAGAANVLDDVHASCSRAVDEHPAIAIDAAAAAALAASLDAAAVHAAGARASVFPLKFDSLEAELTFLALYHMLDFGSGYDGLLRAAGGGGSAGRGAREATQFGAFGLALSAKRLDAPFMRAFTPYHVHSNFGVEAKVEVPLQPGITISRPGPLAPFAAALHGAVVEAGAALERAGCRSLGQLVLRHVDDRKAAGKPPSAAALVEELAEAIPSFQDAGLFVPPPQQQQPAAAAAAADAAAAAAATDAPAADQQDQHQEAAGAFRVTFLRKAQLLAADLAARFAPSPSGGGGGGGGGAGNAGEGEGEGGSGGEGDARFAWADADKLSADSGAVLAAVVRRLGLVSYGPALAAALDGGADGGGPDGGGEPPRLAAGGADERGVRASAIAAVDAVVEAAAAAAAADGSSGGGRPFNAQQLGAYLLAQVCEDGPRLLLDGAELRPHQTVGTVAY